MPTDTTAVGKTVPVPDPVRTVRVPDELWQAAQDRAWERREKAGPSGPMRLALEAYVADADAFMAACAKIVGESA